MFTHFVVVATLTLLGSFASCLESTTQCSDDAVEAVSMIQRSGRHAVGRRQSVAPSSTVLHCCDSFVDESPVLLACDMTPSDFITAVPFAVLREAPSPGQELYHCGTDELPETCSTSVENSSIVKSCEGRQSCSINLALFQNPCPAAAMLQFRVRWTCHCDTPPYCTGEKASLPALPLRARGNIILDASNSRFRITGINWAGAHITNAPGGLDKAPLGSLTRMIRKLGFNVVRLTWSVEAVLTNPVVDSRIVAANPSLVGLRFLEVFDAVVRGLQHEGILIWLDNHMLDTDWCCDRLDCNGFWFNSRFSEDDWIDAWRTLARRYRDEQAFVGVGLKNEPHSTCGGRSWGGKGDFCNATCLDPVVEPMGCVEMEWSSGPAKYQWRRAATRAGLAVLQEKPSLIVSVSGLEYSNDLKPVAAEPVELPSEHLVYEAHDYSWSTYSRFARKRLIGGINGHEEPLSENDAKGLCNQLGFKCSGVTCDGTNSACRVRWGNVLEDGNRTEFTFRKELDGHDPYPRYVSKLTEWWGFLLNKELAPVFLSEFGFSQDFTASDSDVDYVHKLSSYIQEGGPLADKGGLDWAYWQLGGVQVGGTGRVAGQTESFGLLNRCWTAAASADQYNVLRKLMDQPLPQSQQPTVQNPTEDDQM